MAGRTVLERREPKGDAYDRVSLVGSEPQSITVHDLYNGTSKATEVFTCQSATEFAATVSIPAAVLERDYDVVQEGDDEPEEWSTYNITTGSAVDIGLGALLRHALIDDEEETDDEPSGR